MKNWFAVDIVVHADAAEAVESAFNRLESLGNEIDSFRHADGAPLRVTGYFDALPNEADIRLAVDASLMIYGFTSDAVKDITTRAVEQTDWLAEWKKYWKPTVIGNFIIAPPWEVVDKTEKIVISIEPNMAFGTGTHETTQLCLQAITDNYRNGQSFLDVGTGTGILAIAAAKLAKDKLEILACDTDADSVAIAKENAILNGVGEKIEYFLGSIDGDTPAFDFVCANLTIDVIVPLLPLLLEKTKETLVLSGILLEQRDIIVLDLQKFEISNFKFETSGEWIAVIISMD
ncbi:MAG: 50S ribosomal protein L11 methyltransferase [Chloracidobacterium sp.]|nr:50S ribosomal protein L11 methyltransferase [Chloracidobacterium sp.]